MTPFQGRPARWRVTENNHVRCRVIRKPAVALCDDMLWHREPTDIAAMKRIAPALCGKLQLAVDLALILRRVENAQDEMAADAGVARHRFHLHSAGVKALDFRDLFGGEVFEFH